MVNKKLVALLVVFVAALVGLVYTIERSARPPSDRAGIVAGSEEGAGHSHEGGSHEGHAH